MLSLRTLARSAPRCARTISSQGVRVSLGNAQRPSTFGTVLRQAKAFRPVAAFSTSTRRFEQEGIGEFRLLLLFPSFHADAPTVNDELAAKLESELSLEKDMRNPDVVPSHLNEYIENSSFEVRHSCSIISLRHPNMR